MMSVINYKFISDNCWFTIPFEGEELNFHEFKRRVLIQRDQTSYAVSFEMIVTDIDSNYTYKSHKESLKTGSRVIITRERATEDSLLVRILKTKKEKTPDIMISVKPDGHCDTEMSELYKKHLETQAGNQFWTDAYKKLSLGDKTVCEDRNRKPKSPQNPQSLKAQPGNQEILEATATLRFNLNREQSSIKDPYANNNKLPTGVPRGNYICRRCHRPGHFKHLCPLLWKQEGNPEMSKDPKQPAYEIMRATGIPKSDLIELKYYVKGCLLTSWGTFAFPRQKAETILKPPGPKVERDEPEKLDEFRCRICLNIMNEAMLMNCCGEGCCLICLREYICSNGKCPGCKCKGKHEDDMLPNYAAREVISDYHRREQEWIDETWRKPVPQECRGIDPKGHEDIEEFVRMLLEKAGNILSDYELDKLYKDTLLTIGKQRTKPRKNARRRKRMNMQRIQFRRPIDRRFGRVNSEERNWMSKNTGNTRRNTPEIVHPMKNGKDRLRVECHEMDSRRKRRRSSDRSCSTGKHCYKNSRISNTRRTPSREREVRYSRRERSRLEGRSRERCDIQRRKREASEVDSPPLKKSRRVYSSGDKREVNEEISRKRRHYGQYLDQKVERLDSEEKMPKIRRYRRRSRSHGRADHEYVKRNYDRKRRLDNAECSRQERKNKRFHL